jgi:rhodanese-related sulfurtransferase
MNGIDRGPQGSTGRETIIMTTRHPAAEAAHRAPVSRRAVMGGLAAVGAALVLGTRTAAAGDTPIIAADEAAKRANAGELTVVDVRSPQEWRQTGVPKGSQRVTIHNPGGIAAFVEEMKTAVGGDLEKPVALICARGNRSTMAYRALKKAGFTQLLDVKEGMLGSNYGPGWLRRGLPVEGCATC